MLLSLPAWYPSAYQGVQQLERPLPGLRLLHLRQHRRPGLGAVPSGQRNTPRNLQRDLPAKHCAETDPVHVQAYPRPTTGSVQAWPEPACGLSRRNALGPAHGHWPRGQAGRLVIFIWFVWRCFFFFNEQQPNKHYFCITIDCMDFVNYFQ